MGFEPWPIPTTLVRDSTKKTSKIILDRIELKRPPSICPKNMFFYAHIDDRPTKIL